MVPKDELAIQQLIAHLIEAWNRGDAAAYGSRYLTDATFTNVNGTYHTGRDEFNSRHQEIFRGVFKDTNLTMTIKSLRFVRPDVALVDIDVGVAGCLVKFPGVEADSDGVLRTCLLMVLTKENDSWWIAAYHNVWRSGVR